MSPQSTVPVEPLSAEEIERMRSRDREWSAMQPTDFLPTWSRERLADAYFLACLDRKWLLATLDAARASRPVTATRFVDGGGPRVAPYPPLGVEPTDTLAADLYACSPTMLRIVADFLLEHGWTEPLDDEGTFLAALPVREDEPTGIDPNMVSALRIALDRLDAYILATEVGDDAIDTDEDRAFIHEVREVLGPPPVVYPRGYNHRPMCSRTHAIAAPCDDRLTREASHVR